MELTTIARSYAVAIFNFATENHSIKLWNKMLIVSVELINHKEIIRLINSKLHPRLISNLFIECCGNILNKNGKNLIHLMSENNRLKILPDVLKQFIYLKKLNKNTSIVEITSARILHKNQVVKLTNAIKKIFPGKLKLKFKIDNSIIAGLIIRSGDLIIDNSIRNRIKLISDILQY